MRFIEGILTFRPVLVEPFFAAFFVIVFSSIKFMLAPALAVLHYRMHYCEAVFYTSLGGGLGITVFTHLSKAIIRMFVQLSVWINISSKRKTRKKISFRNRLIVRIKNRYGLWGLIILTPVFFSIPLGAFLAQRYYPRPSTVYMLLLSVVCWSLCLNAFFILF